MSVSPDCPTVTVIVPAYNRADLLPRALDSVLSQTFGDLEVLVVDDGSTDGTANLVREYEARDRRVRYLRQPHNAGVSAARNRGLREARGKFIAFLDSDDEWFPEKIAHQAVRLQDLPARVGLIYCGVRTVNDEGGWTFRPQHAGSVHNELLLKNAIHSGSGVIIRREVVDAVGYFDEDIPAIEDYDYWIRIARHFDFSFVEAPLVRYYDGSKRERKSLDTGKNLEARMYLFEKHKVEMRQAGVAHSFLLESARRHLRQGTPDTKKSVQLLVAALWERPTDRQVIKMIARLAVPAPLRKSLNRIFA